jgi:hypothetical protein
MAPYDSDSSGDEGEDYTKTNVVLGFAATDSAEQVDVISHLGGTPVCFQIILTGTLCLANIFAAVKHI